MNDHAAHKVAELKWRSSLSPAEQELAAVAEKMDAVLPALGATYRAPFFLYHYLANSYAISGELVVGFVNNGEDNIYRSHAWLVYEGQITDLAISRHGGVGSDQAGPLMICGFPVRPGKKWNYHKARPSGSIIAVQELVPQEGDKDAMQHAEELHLHMVSVAQSMQSIRAYLDRAPDAIDYDALVDLLK